MIREKTSLKLEDQNTEYKPASFICSHVADRRLLAQGFTFPGTMLVDFTSWFGTLAPGQTRDITIRLDGASCSARLGNRNFDRAKWPSHREMYQVRRSAKSFAYPNGLVDPLKVNVHL